MPANLRTVVITLAFLALASCAELKSMVNSAPKPSASLHDIAFKKASLTSTTLQFDVDVTNPYDVPLPLVNLDYSLSAGGSSSGSAADSSSGMTRLLKGVADVQGTIPAKASKRVSLPVEIGYLDVLKFAQGLHAGSSLPYIADVKLGVDAPAIGRLNVPIGKSGKLDIPSIPGL